MHPNNKALLELTKNELQNIVISVEDALRSCNLDPEEEYDDGDVFELRRRLLSDLQEVRVLLSFLSQTRLHQMPDGGVMAGGGEYAEAERIWRRSVVDLDEIDPSAH